MGKAMMGTGEAAGDKRAVQAAEAAIANPLLDETSMKGARGLLISITGGNDLTLYEVDEAASRIRQEVDEEANIILGATFDSALDGVVRVSVVATGIDQAAISQIEPVSLQTRQEPAARPRAAGPMRPAPAPTPAPSEPAAIVADVEIQPVAPPAAPFPEPVEGSAGPEDEEEEERSFIPPAPEHPHLRPLRMPQIEDLPQVAQNQFRALREAQAAAAPPAETRRRSLLEKLAAFGITRHEEEPAPASRSLAPAQPSPQPSRPHTSPLTQGELARAQPRQAAGRSLPAALDPHGRPLPRPAPMAEDDHLEIPAFLRRQTN